MIDAIGPVWPDWSVEQPLDRTPTVISQVRIWAAAGFDHGEAPLAAALLRGADGESIRQVRAQVSARKLLAPYVLVFPPYRPEPDEELILQLHVSTERSNYVMFGAGKPGEGIAPPAINRQPIDQGPLAYEFIWTGAGWRAALEGSKSDLARLAGAIAAALGAVALHPFGFRTLRKTTQRVKTAFLTFTGPIQSKLRQARDGLEARTSRVQTPAVRRGFYIFPWLIPAFAILHYLASNLLIFRVSDSIALGVVAMAIVATLFAAFRLVLKSSAIAAALTGLLGIAFFSYGHIHLALGERADDRYLLGLGTAIVVGLGVFIRERPELARKIGLMLNVGSVVLVVLPAYQIAMDFHAGSRPQAVDASDGFPELDQRLAETKDRLSRDQLRDIYYIILDEYPRSGSPPEFDNIEFVQELENRGFYVAPQARSNYVRTHYSVPSSLNMYYLDAEYFEINRAAEHRRLRARIDAHTLGRILTTIGYGSLHISSGFEWTKTSSNAHVVVDFSPSGTLLSGDETKDTFTLGRATRLSGRFTRTFLQTTAVKPFLSPEFGFQHNAYSYRHPYGTLAWLDFMKEVGTWDRPKFVFAHLIKPHWPYSFDRYGNVTFQRSGWSDDHDPTVPEAFYGQLIWLNGQMLEVIDAILDDYEEPPIIVIAGDHGHEKRNPSISHDILAAFLLPDGGETALYPSITSVNHFRAILDYYFELNLGLLEDRVYHSAS